MDRREVLIGLGALAAAPARDASPRTLGTLAAAEWLGRAELMRYDVGDVHAVHYAEVACALGAARLAERRRDRALLARVVSRHRRLLEAGIPNTANHVDANVYGVWPLELARQTGDRALLARGLAMADGQWEGAGAGALTPQARWWIDDMWMIGALQMTAWRATREPRYLDRAALMARLYVAKLQQPGGLFHHGPDAPFFWGRGNGWVAAGLAEILSDLPAAHPDRAPVLAGYRRMMAALLAHQAPSGMWRQLIDHDEAWEESSGTAMFGFAMRVGVQRGLLQGGGYRRAAARAWEGVSTHIGADGRLADICVGTGQSRDAAYYLARPKVIGDLHGQAALMWFAAASG